VGAPAPLQEAVAVGMETLGQDYYDDLKADYRARRDILCSGLAAAGFRCTPPEGSYYVIADFSDLSDLPDDEFATWLTIEHKVATVPGSSFCSDPAMGRRWVRFAFCKKEATLKAAVANLNAVRSVGGGGHRVVARAQHPGA
jgi:aspartate/methionine/tyrosine aminotransferase